DDNSGVFGKVFFNKNDKEWIFEGKFSDICEEDCLSIYNILSKLNKKEFAKRSKNEINK
ncbi:hypothetical protein LCGC14_3039740, partial [marine sediment metagenome]